MSRKLENRVAVITGVTSGMALATAKLFVEEGAYMLHHRPQPEKLDKAIKEIGKNVNGVQGDAGNLADLDRLFDVVKNEKGHIDVLFASAGIGDLSKPLGSITEKGFDDTFNVNVRGTLFTVQKATATYEGRWVNHSGRRYCRSEGISWSLRLQRQQSRGPFFLSNLDCRAQRKNQGQRH